MKTKLYNGIERPIFTPERISSLRDDEVFVFGSNPQGHHAGGAAATAHAKFGAVWGKGVGIQGQSYAIPTMHGGVDTIRSYVDDFIKFADSHPELYFYVTRIGCGIAGYKDEEIAPLFYSAYGMPNVSLPESFVPMNGELPEEFKTMAYGQIRTLVDIAKALNERERFKSSEEVKIGLTKFIEHNLRNGDEIAFMAVRTINAILCRYENESPGAGVDIYRLEKDMETYHENTGFLNDCLKSAYYQYSAHKIVRFIRFLNEFRRYQSIEDLRKDLLPAICVNHCGANEPDYFYSFNRWALWEILRAVDMDWNIISTDGRLDNDKLEYVVIGKYNHMVDALGIKGVLATSYGYVGCHPDIQGPRKDLHGPYFRDRGLGFEKGCSDFRRWPFSGTSFEMKHAIGILKNDPNYALVEDRFYIPIRDYSLPVYSNGGKLQFPSEDAKRSFIEQHAPQSAL